MTKDDLVTRQDLDLFREQLTTEILQVLQEVSGDIRTNKQWLRSTEVRKLLGISASTLQNFRINNTLPWSKLGGVIYYNWEVVNKILTENKRGGKL